MAIGGVLQEFPIVTLVLAGLILAIPLFFLLPLTVGILAIAATAYGLLMTGRLPIYGVVIVTAVIWWLIANLIARLTGPRTEAGPPGNHRLIRFWIASIWWGSRILSYLCPAVITIVLIFLGLDALSASAW